MILQDIFENRLSDIHAAYQEYLRIGKSEERAKDFENSWGMSPDTWVRRHQDEINKLEAHQRPQPVGDEHLRYGSAVPPMAEGATVAYVVSYFDTKTGDKGESTVSALTQQDAKDQIVDLMHERGYDVVVTGVRSAQGVAEAEGDTYRIIRTTGHGVKDVFGAGYSLEQAKGELAKCLAHPLHTKHGHKFEIVKHSKQGVAEGSQKFSKPEPYWVCVNDKKWKRFETYAHARAVHDRLEKKLRDEGSDKKVSLLADDQLDEKQDACYHKVKSRYKVWPSAYASGALVQCRKKGAANWGKKTKK